MAKDGGSIRVLLKLDTDELEDKLEEAYTKLKKFTNEATKLAKSKMNIEAKIKIDEKDFEKKLETLDLKRDIELEAKRVNGEVTPDVEKRITAKYDMLRAEAEANYGKKLEENRNKLQQIESAIQSNVASQQQLNTEIETMNNELDKRDYTQSMNENFNGVVDKAREFKDNLKEASISSLNNINKKVSGIGKSLQGVTKKVIKWGLAIFSIRSAYNLVRSSVSEITQHNQELANKLNVIKGALASAIEPIVTKIINLLYTALSFVNQIITKLTGKNLFASAKKNLKSGAGSAKEINKQLAGFDEMNVLNDSSSGGGTDLSGLDNVETGLLNVLEQFKQYFNEGNFGAIAQIISEKIVGSLNTFADKIASIDWSAIGRGISDFLTNIDFSGILVGLTRVFGEAVLGFQDLLLNIDWATFLGNLSKGFADAIFKLSDYLSQVKWDEIGKKISDTFASIDWAGIVNSILTYLWTALMGIKDLFLNIDWKEVASTLSDTIHSWITTIITLFQETDWKQLGEDIVDAIFDFIENVDWFQLAVDIFTLLANGMFQSIDLIIGIFGRLIDRIKEWLGISSPSKLFEEIGTYIMEGLRNGINSMIETIVGIFSTIWARIKGVFSSVGNWFKDRFKEAWNNIKSVFNSVGTFFGGIWNTIKSKFTEIGTKIGDAVGTAFKGVINSVLSFIEKTINGGINSINKLIKGINAVGSVLHLGSIKELKQLSLPRLAKGGIINMPNKGVMVGSAIAGESGKEGILPLTDTQAMQQLGEMIGRYITINANITNTMNGRVISRELQKINNENDFAFNR